MCWIGQQESSSSEELLQGFNTEGQLYLESEYFFRIL